MNWSFKSLFHIISQTKINSQTLFSAQYFAFEGGTEGYEGAVQGSVNGVLKEHEDGTEGNLKGCLG